MMRSLTILTTTRCTLACQHCLHGYNLNPQDFPLSLLPKLLEDARILGAGHVTLTGGEPGLHPEFGAMVQAIVEKGYTWSFMSNGQQVQPYLSSIEAYGEHLRSVSISLDGARAQTHDHMRGAGAYDRAISTMRTYVERNVNLSITTSLNRLNYAELNEIVALAGSLRAKSVAFGGTIPTAWNRHLALNDRECLALFRRIEAMRETCDITLYPRSSLFTHGGIHFCSGLGLHKFNFNACGELLFCCDMAEEQGIIGSLYTHTLDELLARWLQASSDLQAYRMKRMAGGSMGEGFDTCAFCNHYFREQYGHIGRRQFLAAGVLGAAGLVLAACAPEAAVSESGGSSAVPLEENTITATQPKATASSTAATTATATHTPEPSATAQYYDTFVPQLGREEVQVVYSPSVVRVGEKLNAAISLPVETAGSHGLPFSEVYYVSVEVFTPGSDPFTAGQSTGTHVTFKGEAAIGGSTQAGKLVITWRNPTYSSEISYVYVFTIYPLANALQPGKGIKLARLKAVQALQQVTLAGLPDPAEQVTFLSAPASEPGGGDGEGGEGTSSSSGGTIVGTMIGN